MIFPNPIPILFEFNTNRIAKVQKKCDMTKYLNEKMK